MTKKPTYEELEQRVKELEKEAGKRKRAEGALQETEHKYRTLLECLPQKIFHKDRNSVYVSCNENYARDLKIKPEEISGKTDYEFFPKGLAEKYREDDKRIVALKKPEEIEEKYIQEGQEVWVQTVKTPIKDEKGDITGVLGIFWDITERRRAKEALQKAHHELEQRVQERIAELAKANEELKAEISERKRAEGALVGAKENWENTFNAITDMIMLLDNEHKIVRTNSSTTEAFNTTEERLVGKKCYEVVHGQSQPVEKCPLITTTQTKKPSGKEVTVPLIGRTCMCSTSPIVDHEGNLTGYTHSLKDITESKRLEAQLQQLQKLEAMGTLAGGIAHDFNNLLMGIQGNVSLMLFDKDDIHPDYERLRNIEKQVQSGARLTSHLLGYARGGRYEVKPIALNQLLEETVHTFGRTKKAITIHRELAEDLFAIEADRGQIEQVLWNVYVNAADAMPRGGDLFLQTMNVAHRDIKGKLYKPKPGNYVLLMITDTGMGMDRKTMERIFDPFFTTKKMGRGTGLGLASAYGIIKAHGGYIDIDSKKGEGATFSIYLPASEKRVQKTVDTTERSMEGTGTVLLVDDEEMVLEVGQRFLEIMGYRVLLARDGKEAVEVYKKNYDIVDVVVLDMVMPTMGGGDAYNGMKEINQDIKALLSSGFSIDGEATEILDRGCNGFIQKPFTMQELSMKIGEILEEE